MSLFCPLASGSKGNSLFLSSNTTRILIDAGISAKVCEARLKTLGHSLSDIEAIVVTHEHADHIRGIEVIASRYNIPVLANHETAKAILSSVKKPIKLKIFSTGEEFTFGDITIDPFTIQHDTLDPVAFVMHFNGIKLGICADIGFATTLAQAKLTGCDYLYIEANHEPSMVHACRRPSVYKQRVLGRQGHLSNDECIELVSIIKQDNLKEIYLAHLSEECNHPELALKKMKESLNNPSIKVHIAEQHGLSTPLYLSTAEV